MRKSIFNVSALIFLLSLNIANAQAFTEQELSMQRIQDRMNSIEKSMSTMQRELYRNNKGGGKPQISAEPIGADEERSRDLNGRFEEVEHKINTLASKLDKIIADIDLRLATLEKKVSSAPAPVAAVEPNAEAKPEISMDKAIESAVNSPEKTVNTDKVNSAVQYDQAFEFLRLAKYPEAEKAFKDFIANNKESDLLGNAHYWLGETYYIRSDYQQAAVNFLKGYKDFPKGNKASDNLLKLAMSLKGLKKEKEACATLDKLKKEYPEAEKELLVKAAAEREGLKCK